MKQKTCRYSPQSGNALIYILIAVALFAALSMTLTGQTRNESTNEVDEAKNDMYATQLISYAAQAKSILDQMMFSGSGVGDFVFTAPGESGFNTAPHIHKIYHPAGGGLMKGRIPESVKGTASTTPAAGWYMGRFNNVEWTATGSTEIILTAYNIKEDACKQINEQASGSTSIPVLPGDPKTYLIDGAVFSGSNSDLTTAACAACEGFMSLCVSDNTATIFAFYTVLADR